MTDLDKFISFLFLNIDNSRIEISKKMKYGFRYYYLTVTLHYERANNGNNTIGSSSGEGSKELTIVFDTRNQCIEVGQYENFMVFEDVELLNKWVNILEDYYTKNILSEFGNVVSKFLSNTSSRDKDLWRQWSVGKIIDPDN